MIKSDDAIPQQFKAVAAVLPLTASARAPTNSTVNSQLRLAYAGEHGMTVSWNSFTKLDNPTVVYGRYPWDMNHVSSSDESVTYNTSLTYNNHEDRSTKPFTFCTSRTAGDDTPYSIAVVIDMGTMAPTGLATSAGTGVSTNNIVGPNDNNTIQSLTAVVNDFDFILHPGDLAYADAWLKEEIQGFLPNTTIADGYRVYESILNDFYDEMTPVTTKKPWMVEPGNHESNCDAGRTTDPTTHITYNIPSDVSGGTGNFWYSFDHGLVHHIMLDTETDLGHRVIGPDQVDGTEGDDSGPFNQSMNAQTDWVQADLAAVDRTVTPWVIVSGHRPWYLSFKNDTHTICWSCMDVFEPLFLQYGLKLYLSGHAHFYQRSAPIANGVIDPNESNNHSAPWYITNGAAGHYDGLSAMSTTPAPFERFRLDINDATYDWSKLTFHNCTHMTHEFIASRNGTVIGSATLFKNRTCSSCS